MVLVALQCALALWGCLLTAVHLEPFPACKEKQYSYEGRCCDLCQPGKKLVSECTEVTQTQCLPCGRGEFLGTWNHETYCHQHRHCEPNQGLQVLEEGTSNTDTTCACQEGRHCVSQDCDSCAPHTECGPGFGVKQLATGNSDTICEHCPVGYFSNVSSATEKCQSWTSCEANKLVVVQEGTRETDTVCGVPYRNRVVFVIAIVVGVVIILLVSISIRKVAKKPKNKAFLPKAEPQDPIEVEDVPGQTPATPVQETLLGCQPVTQEDGKESRISVQERQ